MKTSHFPYIALGLALFLFLIVMQGSQLDIDGTTTLPLLTLLVVSEFSFFITAIGTYIGIKNIPDVGIKSAYTIATLFCGILSLIFLFLGITLWPL